MSNDRDSGVPVRAGPVPGSGAGAALARWRGPVRVELGAGQVPGPVRGRGQVVLGADLHKLWNAAKKADPALAWWGENSKCAYQEAFRDLDRALRTSSSRGRASGRGSGSASRVQEARQVPGLVPARRRGHPLRRGRSPCPASARSAPTSPPASWRRRLDDGSARILSATVTRTAQRWFVSFTVEVERAIPERHARPGSAIGSTSASRRCLPASMTRERNHFAGPRPYGPRCADSGAPVGRTPARQPGSANRRKYAAPLARIHARVANIRADALHKATDDWLPVMRQSWPKT